MLHSCSTSEQGSAFDPSQDLILGAKSSSLFIAIVQHCYDNGYHTSEPSQAKSVKSSHVWAMSVKPCCCCICQAKSYKSGQVSQVKSVKSSHVVVAYVLVSLSHAVFSLLSLTAECIVKVYLDRFRRKLCNLQDTCVIFLCLWVHTASVHLCHYSCRCSHWLTIHTQSICVSVHTDSSFIFFTFLPQANSQV